MNDCHRASAGRRLAVVPFATVLLLAATSSAQSPADPAGAAPAATPVLVGGYVDAYYQYNFNGVDPLLRTFDVAHDAFSLSLADVSLSKAVSAESRVGFRAELAFGKTADLIASYEPASDGKEVTKHVLQAYASVLAGSRLQVDVGKFLSPLGAEVVSTADNWNYGRSVLFGYAIPFYHLGVRATYPVSERVSVTGLLVNGWNNSTEADHGKTAGLGVTLKPSARLTWAANYMGGREATGADTRHLFDTTLTFAATPRFSLMANGDYGQEGDATWWGVAAYARAQLRPSWALAGRYEYVDDADGGFMTIGRLVQTLTLTSEHVVASSLRVRLEYRGDFAEDPYFADDDGGLSESQHALSAGVVFTFGGRI
jgi:hypothetical protein